MCRWRGETRQGDRKRKRMNRVNVCELTCDSCRQVRKAYKSLFSTTACYRWRRWLCLIPDDDHNELSLSFTRLFTGCQRDWQQFDTSDRRPLSGTFPAHPASTELKTLLIQKRSRVHCFSITVAGNHITTRAPVRIWFRDYVDWLDVLITQGQRVECSM